MEPANPQPLNRAPLLAPLVGVVCGIVVARLPLPAWWALVGFALALAIYFASTYWLDNPAKGLRLQPMPYLWGALLFASLGFGSAKLHEPAEPAVSEDVTQVAEAKVMGARTGEYGERLEVELLSLRDAEGNVQDVTGHRMLLYGRNLQGEPGDVVVFPFKPEELEPNNNLRNPQEVLERQRLKGIRWRQNLKEDELAVTGQSALASLAHHCRQRCAIALEKSGLGKDTSSILKALLTGDASDLDPYDRRLYSDAGVAHILALSGMHVGIVASVLMLLLLPLNVVKGRQTRFALVLAALWAFAWFTGMSPSTTRAVLMASVLLITLMAERSYAALNSLCFAVMAILLWNPHALYEVSLQASALSVLFLIGAAGAINPIDRHKHRWLYKVTELAACTLAVSCGLWALNAWHFHQVSLMTLAVNMLVLPLLPLYVGLGIAYLVLRLAGGESQWMAWVLDRGVESFNSFCQWITGGGTSALRLDISATALFAVMSASVLFLIALNYKKRVWWGMAAVTGIAAVAIMIAVPAEDRFDGLVFRKQGRTTSVAVYDGNAENVFVAPQGKDSRIEAMGKAIVVVDCNRIKDTEATQREACHYLVVGSGFTGRVEQLLRHYEPEVLVIGNGVYSKRGESLAQEAAELGQKVWHIRQNGALRVAIKGR